MNRCVIVGGAEINNYDKLQTYLAPDDFVIYCDCGLRHMNGLGAAPNLIVGDFDSYENPHLEGVETIVLPREKDDTDSVYALKQALGRGYRDFLLFGFVGQRLDHTLGNVSTLLSIHYADGKALLVDDYSEMLILAEEPAYIDDSFSYFSLMTVFGPAHGLTIENAKYPMNDGEVRADYQFAISNEVLPGKKACVTLREGCMLLIKVF